MSSATYDIISFVETYLTCDDATAKFLVGANDEYDLFRFDRTNRAGGGVAVYCKRVLNPVRIPLPEALREVEAVCIDVVQRYRIVSIYRPPNCSNIYHDNMCKLITFLALNSEYFVIFGDFNLPGIQWPTITCPNTHAHNSFVTCITENALTQHVHFPTRGHNILNLILSSDPMAVTQVNAIDNFRSLHNASDHISIVCKLNIPYVSTSECHNTGHFDFKRGDFLSLKYHLSCVNWHELLYSCPTVDSMLTIFLDTFFSICSLCIPFTSGSKRKATNYPSHVKKLFSKCKYLSKHKHLPNGVLKWRTAQDNYMLAIQQFVIAREQNILESGDCSAFYKYVNLRRIHREGVAPLANKYGKLATSNNEKAEILNSQFSSVFTTDDGRVPFLTQRTDVQLSSVDISPERVRKFMCKLPAKFSRSPDGIPTAVLKILSYELCIPLHIIFKTSLDSTTCPTLWKYADITPIFKKGDPSQANNYRPISILPAMCKLFERILTEDIYDHLSRNHLITSALYGFIKGRSTELQLLNCSCDWVNAIDTKCFADTVYIDLAKAFDTVSHNKLLHKLQKYGITGNILQWFSSYLNNRKQRVKLSNTFSSYADVTSGVPQGSCTGPLLFILYVNDLPDNQHPTNITVNMFSDDTKFTTVFSDALNRVLLQDCLSSFTDWADLWQLQIAEHKCCVLSFGNPVLPSYYMNDVQLTNVTEYRDLGVLVDNQCLFRQHVSTICQKAYRATNVLFRCFNTDNANALIRGYKSFVRPILEYCSTVWNPFIHAKYYLGMTDELENIQRYFTRRLYYRCRLDCNHDYLERINHLQLESLELRRIYNDMTMVFKIVHKFIDLKDSDLLTMFNTTNNSVTTRGHAFKLKTRSFRLDIARNHFCNRVVPLWNSLPSNIVNKRSPILFKAALRNIDFTRAIKFTRHF